MKKTMNKNLISNIITFGLIIIAYFVLTSMINAGSLSSLLQGLLIPVCTYIILAISLNLTVGILGELSLGHAGFMCIGAFSSAVFSKLMTMSNPNIANWQLMIMAIIVGALAAAVFGFLIGVPVLRLRGDYLAIVTLAFGEIIKNIINILYLGKDSAGLHIAFDSSKPMELSDGGTMIIEGAKGIMKTPKISTFAIGIILVIITLLIVLNLVNSRTGRAVMAIRDDRIAAESVGINITKFKLFAFVISAALAGVAGVLYAHNMPILQADPQKFGYNASIMILVYVVLGGIGNIKGSIVSTIILVLIPELLRGLDKYRMLVYAIVLIVTMLINWSPKAIEVKKSIVSRISPFFKKLSICKGGKR